MLKYFKIFILTLSLSFFVACGGTSTDTNDLGAFHNNEFSIDFDDSWKVVRDFQVLQDERIVRGNIVFTLLHKNQDIYSALTISKSEYNPQKDILEFADEIKNNLENSIHAENLKSSRITIDSIKTTSFTFNIDKQSYYISLFPKDSILYYFVGSTTDKEGTEINSIEASIESFYLLEATPASE